MAHGEKLKAFWEKVKELFHKIDKYLKEHIDVAITITENIKKALDSPVAVLITDIIPGNWDEAVRVAATKALEIALNEMAVIKECESMETVEQKLQCYLEHAKTLPIRKFKSDVGGIATIMTSELDGNKHSYSDYDVMRLNTYKEGKLA